MPVFNMKSALQMPGSVWGWICLHLCGKVFSSPPNFKSSFQALTSGLLDSRSLLGATTPLMPLCPPNTASYSPTEIWMNGSRNRNRIMWFPCFYPPGVAIDFRIPGSQPGLLPWPVQLHLSLFLLLILIWCYCPCCLFDTLRHWLPSLPGHLSTRSLLLPLSLCLHLLSDTLTIFRFYLCLFDSEHLLGSMAVAFPGYSLLYFLKCFLPIFPPNQTLLISGALCVLFILVSPIPSTGPGIR